jgi:hypothetical protein
MIPQFKDLVTRYKPSLIFSDGEWDLSSAEWQSPDERHRTSLGRKSRHGL